MTKHLIRNGITVLVAFICLANKLEANKISKTLYVNKGIFTTVDTSQFPCLAFNKSTLFDALNEVIMLTTNDTLILSIVNNDSSIHGFAIQDKTSINDLLNPHDSVSHVLHFGTEGIFIFYDAYHYPENRYMGLGGLICVSNHKHAVNFFWNIKEHQKLYNLQIGNQQAVSWQDYYPDYFTINGKSHPDLQKDTTARVNGNIGDTIRIFMANTGQSKHSIHFHGFHSKVIFSTAGYIPPATEKETYPLGSMQCVMIEMIPDKVGLYSVHDHNLVAVSGGGTHPNGMFIIMEIK